MSVRSRAGGTAVVAKTFGTAVPESFRQGEIASQITPASPFSPGQPIGPYDGYDRNPRAFNYVTGYNISTRPRLHERVSFGTLKGLIEAYDVADICIWHRIDSIRSLKWKLLGADHYDGDVTGAIPLGLAALKKPDRKQFFKTWLAKYLYDILAYDAGTLYRLRNRAGRAIGLKVVSGHTIAPLLDYWGDSPDPPAEAYVQYVNGLPWNWLTRNDIIYEPFRPNADSPYGRAPIESIILNANTDLRFQAYFLQTFTEGNLPAAFASAPDSWSPDQIEQFQAYWDSFMYGDQARKHQIRWIPPGSKFEWSNEKEFSDGFPLYMMRKTCSAFHVVPSDLGFTESVNRSSGESQADVQHRVGDLPLMEHVEGVLSAFLLDDLGLPLKFEWDRGEEQVDQLAQAQADQVYMDRAVVGPSEIREMRYGLVDAQPVPRVFFSERAGPIPLISLTAVAGPVDAQTAAPEPGAELPHKAFTVVEGVVTSPPLIGEPLAEQEYGPSALPPGSQPVAKDGEDAPAAGITSETGLYSYDLDDDEEDQAASVAKEISKYWRFRKRRMKSGEWHDFSFAAVDPATAAELNEAGRAAVAKAVSGYDLSPRSGMISLDLPDGTISPVPGGVTDHHITVVYLGPDVDDNAFAQACSRARAAAAAMPGPLSATISGVGSFPPSAGSDGKVPAFAQVGMPGGDVLRSALEDLSASEHKNWKPHVTLACVDEGDPLPDPVPQAEVTFTHLTVHRGDDTASFPLGGEAVAKAGDRADPKGPAWPGWDHDLRAAAYWASLITVALTKALGKGRTAAMTRDWLAGHQHDHDKADAGAWAAAWLAAQDIDLSAVLAGCMPGITADGWAIGAVSATALASGDDPDWGDWQPGGTDAARDRADSSGTAAGLSSALMTSGQQAQQMTAGYVARLGRALQGIASSGMGPKMAAATLYGAVTDQDYAQRSVLTQLLAAAGAAALAVYLKLKVQRVRWVVDPASNVCPVCLANEKDSPYRIQDAPECPAHPVCRCEVVPA